MTVISDVAARRVGVREAARGGAARGIGAMALRHRLTLSLS